MDGLSEPEQVVFQKFQVTNQLRQCMEKGFQPSCSADCGLCREYHKMCPVMKRAAGEVLEKGL